MEHGTGNDLQPLGLCAKRNIAAVTDLEQEVQRQCSAVDRLSDGIARFAGRVHFIVAHACAAALWMLVNAGAVPGLHPFDPYPFCFLNLLVALEVIFLSTVVLMSQNRQSRQAEQRAHLDLQINMLAEQEATKMLQMLQKICAHLGLENVARDRELKEMVEKTHVEIIAQELEKARAA